MAKIYILDDNRATSAFLKIILTRHGHRVSRREATQDVTKPAPDLILINHAFRNQSGWGVFNHLKRIAPHIPAMVYGLDQLNAANANWIVEAVETVIGGTKNHADRHPDASVRRPLFAE